MKRRSLFVALVCRAAGLSIATDRKRFDALAGGYDRRLPTDLKFANGTTPVPGWDELFQKRDGCDYGVVQCSGYDCHHCGTCCGNNQCAENFGNCCDSGPNCSFGFSCCTGFSGCCYADTSFCCSTSPTGCCVKGTQCTANGCVGTPDFIVASKSATTVYTQNIYNTRTVTSTFTSTQLDVTTNIVTQTVTSSDIDVATVISYVTSKTLAKRMTVRYPAEIYTALLTGQKQPDPPAPTSSSGVGQSAVRDELDELGLLPKRAVTSYVTAYEFVWSTVSKDLFVTSSVFTTAHSREAVTSTVTSTIFQNAKTTATVTSTVVVVTTQDTTLTAGDADSTGINTRAKAGIGAGAGAAGLAVIGGLLFLVRRRRPRPRSFNTPDISQLPVVAGSGSSWAPPRLPPPRHQSSTSGHDMSERAAGLASAMARGRQAGSPRSYAEVGRALSPCSGWASPTTPSMLGSSRISAPSSASELMAGYYGRRDATHEVAGVPETTGLGVMDERYEMPGQLYHELPSPPARTYKPYRPR